MGIQEKKQQREIDEHLAGDGQAALRSATGNDAVTSTFAPVGELSVRNLRIALENIKKTIDAVVTLCEDADYKAELAKVATFAFTAVEQVQRKEMGAYVNADLSGTTMNIEVCGSYDANGASGYVIDRIKGLY